jgi:hypothetical protein
MYWLTVIVIFMSECVFDSWMVWSENNCIITEKLHFYHQILRWK